MNFVPFLAFPAFLAVIVLLSQIVFYILNKTDDRRAVSKKLEISELDIGTDAFYFNHANVFVMMNQSKYAKVRFDFSLESIMQIEFTLGQLVGSKKYFSQDFVTGFGCYFGETIIRQIGGEWKSNGSISIFNSQPVNPIREIQTRFAFGYQGRSLWIGDSLIPSLTELITQIQVSRQNGSQMSN